MQPRILYVEDDQENREIMRLLVEDVMGLSDLTMFEDSTNFIERLNEITPEPDVILLDIHVPPIDGVIAHNAKFDIVFLDLEMPNISGYDMLNQLQDDPRFEQVPIVAYTVHVSEIGVAHDLGFHSFLGKPLDADQFPDQLQRILNNERVWVTPFSRVGILC